MSRTGALRELLALLGASKGEPVRLTDDGIRRWPLEYVEALQAERVLTKATPATSAVCPGCEEACIMPVHTPVSAVFPSRSFIVCDRRNDVARVGVSLGHLEQWQVTGDSLAGLVSRLLNLRHSELSGSTRGRWEVGVLKGAKYSAHVVLVADGELTLRLAGHSVELAEVLKLEGGRLEIEKRALARRVDSPVEGAGDKESAGHRRKRLAERVKEEKAKGTRAFLKKVAGEEGIGIPRLKQLLGDDPIPEEAKSSLSRIKALSRKTLKSSSYAALDELACRLVR